MSLIRSLVRPREQALMSIDDVADIMRQGGFVWGNYTTTLSSPKEEIPGDFVGLVLGLYRANPVAFSAVLCRMQIFAQARFRFRQIRDGEPGKTFGKTDLALLEHPEPSLSTSDLLKRALLDADFAGNWFGVRRPDRIKRIRPDWVYIVKASRNPNGEIDDVDTEVIGIVYQAGGPYSDHRPESFAVGEYAHFAPIPDPIASYRGMSWMTPIVREVQGDQLMTTHKLAFLEHGATPNVLVKFPPTLDKTKALEFKAIFEQEHEGAFNAYRTVFLGGGSDLSVVGSNMQQMDFKAVQGAGETRIAMASRVPAVLLQISEGLQGSSLNAGNYSAAKKAFGDGAMRDLWQTMAGALEDILPPGPGAELWYDEARIPFLAEDAEAAAQVLNLKSTAMRTLWDGGADPDSAIKAITTGDLTHLKHTGKPSVQLQEGGAPPPNDGSTPPEDAPVEAAWVDVTDLMAYSPGQKRDNVGRFGSGGGGPKGGSSSGGDGSTSAAELEQVIHGPSVPIDKWGKGPTVAPEAAMGSLLEHTPANVKADDIDEVLDLAAALDDKAKAGGDQAELDKVRSADLTDLQVSGELDFGGDGLGILRKDMPQFTAGDVSYLDEYMVHAQTERGWKVETGTTQNPHDIAPSQSEISVAKVGGMVRATRAGTMKRTAEIVIAEDPKTGVKMVVDGHHGWAVATAMKYEDPAVTLQATVIHAPIRDVLRDAIDWTGAQGIARQSITTGPSPTEKKAAVDAAWEAWALRNPDRIEGPPPGAVPLWQVIQMATGEVRCPAGHLVAEVATPPYRFTCRNCKAVVEESGRWAVTTDPKVVSYSPSQPRRSDGKFGTKGAGSAGSGAPSGAGTPGTTATGGDNQDRIYDAAKGIDVTLEAARDQKVLAMQAIGRDLDAAFTVVQLEEAASAMRGAGGLHGTTAGEKMADAMLSTWQQHAYSLEAPDSVALQVAVAREFGTGNGATITEDFASASDPEFKVDPAKWAESLHYDMPVMQAAVRSMYNHTQAKLDDLGVKGEVTLYRGMERTVRDDDYDLDANPASSWSTSKLVAHDFAQANAAGHIESGTIFTMTVPRERILAMPGSGVGCLEEKEVVLTRRDGDQARAGSANAWENDE